jgi:Na+-transporting NADH:ubiquinone oxidoreductase subunit B
LSEADSSTKAKREATDGGRAGSDANESKPKKKKRPLFMRQRVMLKVIYALIPVAAAAVYFFGWRVIAVLALCNALGVATEYIMTRQRNQPISMAVFVTCWLFALSLPPTVPYWIAGVGVVVAILFGKEVFGGFGRNFANPAIVGRAFVYVSFPVELTGSFVPAFKGWPGGFARWSFQSLDKLPEYLAAPGKQVVDAVTSATPMLAYRDFGYETSLQDLLLGTIGTTFEGEYGTQILAAGSMGELSAVIIIAAGIYLMVTKTANWRLTASTVAGGAAGSYLLMGLGAEGAQPFIFKALAGAFLYVSVFMVTDPISAPKRRGAMYVYGGFIGLLIVLLSWKSQFVAAASFAILLGNIVSPLLDMGAKEWADRKKKKKKQASGEEEKKAGESEKPGGEQKRPGETVKKVATEEGGDGGGKGLTSKGKGEREGEGHKEGEGQKEGEAHKEGEGGEK